MKKSSVLIARIACVVVLFEAKVLAHPEPIHCGALSLEEAMVEV
jgi:hypothetical protein